MIFCCNYWRVGKARRYRTNELIAVAINENNEQIVSARLLHEMFLDKYFEDEERILFVR